MTMNIPINGRANKSKSAFRLEYSAGINIQAPPARVWKLMTHAADFARWNSTIKSIEGQIAPGQTIELIAAIAPTRTFNLRIIEFVPEKKMVWSDGNAMFKGVRTYTLAAKGANSTDFTMAEVYTGLMLPMIAGSLPDFGSAFEQFVADLKREAEKAV
ncbi:MAG: SRPBCC domain-containing protein [Anaerolineales bacterium]